ncbi:ATP-binding protein [Streptomyces sp. NBC_00286]|uniref:ATP-binding protein n=1 Tax=Streptomyces sp. NBC_00286 TaxID=2975701 RepID=UPI002E297815|nr:ATP-binding protein [Streptomyces sp. NBC_00286]
MDRGVLERGHELERLAAAARDTADGAGSVALVFGEAGIGKSSLVKAMPSVPRAATASAPDAPTPTCTGRSAAAETSASSPRSCSACTR